MELTASQNIVAQIVPDAELRYRKLFEAAQDGILILDYDTGIIKEVNPASLDLLHATRDEMIGKTIWSINAIIDKTAIIAAFQDIKERGRIVIPDLPLRTNQGEIINAEFSCTSYQVNLDTILQCNIRDITKSKALEANIFEYQHSVTLAMREMMAALSFLIEERDPYTAGHQQQVAKLSVAIARELDLPVHNIEGIEAAALLHDIGKIVIPAEILTKPGELDSYEVAMLRHHAQAGFEALKNVHFPWPVAATILQHHERLDGSGYPNGLKGDSISEEARILMVADSVDAIANPRPYRPGQGLAASLKFISDHKGTLFDSKVVDACLALFKDARFVLVPSTTSTTGTHKNVVASGPLTP